MHNDIYTGKAIVTSTDEHLLLNALGGRTTSGLLIDRTTNSAFGKTIDGALADAILPIRVLIDGASGDGRPPPAYRGAVDSTGTVYNILPGGKPEVGKPVMRVTQQNGVLQIEGKVRSRGELRHLLGRTVQKHGLDMKKVEAMGRNVKEAMPMLSMNLSFSPESTRCIAKMACNLFAHTHSELFREHGFDDMRRFILLGEGEPDQFVSFNAKAVDVDAQRRALGTLDHLLVVRSIGREVLGLVAIYGHLQFAVRLGALEREARIATAYRVDQIGRAHRLDDPRDVRISVRTLEKAEAPSREAFFHEIREAMSRVLRVAMKRQEDIFMHGFLDSAIRDTWGDADGRSITSQMIDALSHVVAERWVQHRNRSRVRGRAGVRGAQVI